MIQGKHVVIVGGAGFLGRVFVRACAGHGARLAVIDICPAEEWASLQLPVELFVTADINDGSSLQNALDTIASSFKTIDAVVNTAYPRNKGYGKDVFGLTLDDFNAHVNLHLGGYFHVMQRFARFFKAQGFGNIINISSIQGIAAPKFEHYEGTSMVSPIEYTAAKTAIIAISRYMAKYLKGTGIRVNCISPGGLLAGQPSSFLERYKASCTSKGMLDPEDITGALLFLISDASKYINGQNIVVDDGWSL